MKTAVKQKVSKAKKASKSKKKTKKGHDVTLDTDLSFEEIVALAFRPIKKEKTGATEK